jgi:Rhodopirellula transposase DDE domain
MRVDAELDPGSHLLGVKIPDKQLAAVPLKRHDWHGEWNYTMPPTAA